MSRGQTPRHRHDGPLRIGWGLSQFKRRGGCRVDSCGHAATGEPPGIHDVEPWRVALQRGRGRSLPGRADQPRRWQARRAETGLAATVGHRHAAAAAWDGKRKGVNGHSRSTCCGSARLAQRGDGSPITTQLPHARPGRVTRPRGAVDCIAFAGIRRAAPARPVPMPCRVGSRADAARDCCASEGRWKA